MMADLHRSYLELLRDLKADLDRLGQLSREKTAAVHHNDLMALDEVLKQEQAMTLSLRGVEQKRMKLLSQLGLADVSLSALPGRYPAELAQEARQTVEALQQSYAAYRSLADTTRNYLELNLHQIGQVIAAAGAAPKPSAGYEAPGAEPPKNMKTDFRA